MAAKAAAEMAASANPVTGAQVREDAQRRRREKKKPNPNNDEKLEELRGIARAAEEALQARKTHPFSKWKVRLRLEGVAAAAAGRVFAAADGDQSIDRSIDPVSCVCLVSCFLRGSCGGAGAAVVDQSK